MRTCLPRFVLWLALIASATLVAEPQSMENPQSVGNPNDKPINPSSGHGQLVAATWPADPNMGTGTVMLKVRGNGLKSGMFIMLSGGPGVPTGMISLYAVSDKEGYSNITLGGKLTPDSTYKVSLFDKDQTTFLNQVSLDLEYLAESEAAKSLGNTNATAGGDSFLDAMHKRHEAKKLERQTNANLKLAIAKSRAVQVQRELYLAEHPDVQADEETPATLTSVNNYVNPNCAPDSTAESQYIRVRRSLVDPKEASDSYGRRLGRRFVVFEITVENNNSSLQYMLHDVSVDLSRMHHLPLGTDRWSFSGQDLIMLRGVPEKGADLDPRNLTYHVAQGAGAVAGGVTGLVGTGIQSLFAATTAAFNGPTLTAFTGIFPDHSSTQLNRLSDSAFTANVVVAKDAAKTFAIFVPERLFMSESEQDAYWKEPASVFTNPSLDFRRADVCVDGTFIAAVTPMTLSSATYDQPTTVSSAVATGASVPVTVNGSNLVAGDVLLDAFDTTIPLTGVDAGGKTGHVQLTIPQNKFQNEAQVSLESKTSGQKTTPVPLTLKQAQSITFDAIKAQIVGTTLMLSGTSSSGLKITYVATPSTVCTVSDITATFVAPGTCNIQATQAGNTTYAAATPVSQSITVN